MMPPVVCYWADPTIWAMAYRVNDLLLRVEFRQDDRLVAMLYLHVPLEYGEVVPPRLFAPMKEGRQGRVEGSKRGACATEEGGRGRGMGDGSAPPGDAGATGSAQLSLPDSAYVHVRGADPDDSGTLASDAVGRGRAPRVD
jgi:hypothetical protein